MDQVPNLLTTDKHYTPGVDDEPDAEGEEMPEEAQEEEEEKERPVCPFETEDAFIAAFNSNPVRFIFTHTYICIYMYVYAIVAPARTGVQSSTPVVAAKSR